MNATSTDVTTTLLGTGTVPAETISIPAQTIQVTVTIPAQQVKLAASDIPVTVTLDETSIANAVKALIESPSGTVVSTIGPAIIDNSGNVWAISATKQVQVNGVVDASTANVASLYYISAAAGAASLIYQVNAAGGVWSKTSPNAAWTETTLPSVAT